MASYSSSAAVSVEDVRSELPINPMTEEHRRPIMTAYAYNPLGEGEEEEDGNEYVRPSPPMREVLDAANRVAAVKTREEMLAFKFAERHADHVHSQDPTTTRPVSARAEPVVVSETEKERRVPGGSYEIQNYEISDYDVSEYKSIYD